MHDPTAGLLQEFARNRGERDFRLAYDAITPVVYGFALRLTAGDRSEADDLVQEAWLRAIERLDQFDATRPAQRWLSGFVMNCWRERCHDFRLLFVAEAEELFAHVTPEEPLWSEHPLLQRAIAALPDGFRAVLLLHDVEGYTHSEIGTLLGIDEGTSKSQLSRARKKLAARLRERRHRDD